MTSRHLVYVGLLTWVVIAVSHLRLAFSGPAAMTLQGMAFVACLLAFVAVFWIATREWCTGQLETTLVALEAVLALVCVALGPNAFLPVLLVIVAAQLGLMPVRYAVFWIAVQSVLLGVLLRWYHNFVPVTLAYFTFQLFGAFAARMAQDEREARQALAAVNAELQVATGLLDMSSRAEERLRIARDLHDLLGHHLAALSINLEVASHLAEGEAKDRIEKSQSLAKLLLSDVRDSVSRLREDEPVDLAAALHSIRDAVPSPSIHVDADAIGVTDPATARTALRAVQEIVTNAVRHSGARNLWMTLTTQDRGLAIDARDDGGGTDHVKFGNGLRGMYERVQQSGGTMDVRSMRGRGFEVHIRLPLTKMPVESMG